MLCFWRLSDGEPFVYLGGLQLVAVATALVIIGTTWRETLISRVLGTPPLVGIGRRSYSLYLWHWPVYVVTRPGLDLRWSSGPTLVLRLVLSAGLAELSYRFVEVPIRRGALGRTLRRVRGNARLASPERQRQMRRSWSAVGASGLCLLLVLGVLVIRADPPQHLESLLASDEAMASSGEQPGTAADPLVPAGAGGATKAEASTASTNPPPPGADPNAMVPGSAVAGANGNRPVAVYAIGDSVMLGARSALTSAIPGIVVNAKVGRYMGEGRALVSVLMSSRLPPSAIVVHLGSNGPASASDVKDIVDAAAERRLIFVTVKVPRRWEGTSNSAITEGAADKPNVRIVEWKRASSSCKGADLFYEDGIHLKPDGATCYANLIKAALD